MENKVLNLKDFRDEKWWELVSKAKCQLTEQLNKAWDLGDILLEVTSKYGEHTFGKFSEDTGVNVRTAYAYKRLATKFPRDTRVKLLPQYPNLSYCHYLTLAQKEGLSDVEINRYLEEANANKLSISQLKKKLMSENPTAYEDVKYVKISLPPSLIPTWIQCRKLAIQLLNLKDEDEQDINSNDMVKEKIILESLHTMEQELALLKEADIDGA